MLRLSPVLLVAAAAPTRAFTCDPSSWPDLDTHVCGTCKALVNWEMYGSTCSGYCSGIGLTCVDGWEEVGDDGCTEGENLGCDRSYEGTSDAICECISRDLETCADVQQYLLNGECEGPAVCQTEYQAYVECHYEDMAQETLGQACDFTCSGETCLGQLACDWDGSPCTADEFCNFDGGSVGSCEKCSDEDHCDRGLPSKGETDCEACCGIKKESNRDNVMLLIIIIVCSVVGGCCLLGISTAVIYSFGGCFCFAKKKKTPTRVAEPSAPSGPVPLAMAEYVAAPPPMSPGTFAKTQEHIRRTAALMAEAPPSPQGPPPLAPIKATETLPAEMP